MAYKQSPGRMNMPKTGKNLPFNMISPLSQNKYEIVEKEVAIKGSTKRTSRKAAKEAAKKAHDALQQGYGTTGYAKKGKSPKLKIGKKRLVDYKSSRGGVSDLELTGQVQNTSGITEKDIFKTIRKTGGYTVTPEGQLKGGTSQTKTVKRRKKVDNPEAINRKKQVADKKGQAISLIEKRRADAAIKKAEKQKAIASKRTEAKARLEAKRTSRAKTKSQRTASLETKKEQRKTKKS